MIYLNSLKIIRKNARLRREYLYKRSVQLEERERLDRKIRVREALEKGLPLSDKDLEKEAMEKEYGFDHLFNLNDKQKKEIQLDNEYATAGASDPKILLTSAHDPSDRMKRFLKEVKYLFPNCQQMNRGTQQIKAVVEAAVQNGFTDLIMLHESRGDPDTLVVCHLPYGPTAYFTMYNTVMRHEAVNMKTEKMPTIYPHLIFHNFKTKLGERVATILKHLFPIPKKDSTRVVTFANDNDFISFRHHVYKQEDKKVLLKEVGPRFELKLYQIKLGTIDQKDAEPEWVLRPYMNSHKAALGKSKEDLLDEENEKRHEIK
ncbi:U3 small nucleolar ribonucleoprotein IMP4 [Acrasis kona]|uniref:U3 small nucleolar ribonucleoprotein IMP4 n=1 Tax=Acrasis kona TaxID=1008807 RepID=A0AAW2YL38_9EUKA